MRGILKGITRLVMFLSVIMGHSSFCAEHKIQEKRDFFPFCSYHLKYSYRYWVLHHSQNAGE